LPRPVRTDLFRPKCVLHSPIKAVYFPKSYDCLPDGLVGLLKSKGISFTVVDGQMRIRYADMPSFLASFDIFVDQTTIPELSKTCLEALSCGLASVTFQDKEHLEKRVGELADGLVLSREALRNREFVLKYHSAEKVAQRLIRIWKDVGGNSE